MAKTSEDLSDERLRQDPKATAIRYGAGTASSLRKWVSQTDNSSFNIIGISRADLNDFGCHFWSAHCNRKIAQKKSHLEGEQMNAERQGVQLRNYRHDQQPKRQSFDMIDADGLCGEQRLMLAVLVDVINVLKGRVPTRGVRQQPSFAEQAPLA